LSTAHQAITHPKFLPMLDYLKEDEDAMRQYGLPSLFVYRTISLPGLMILANFWFRI
jgi:hypothetical protein